MLRGYQAMMLGETSSITTSFPALKLSETVVFIVIAGIIIVSGIYPKIILDISAWDVQLIAH